MGGAADYQAVPEAPAFGEGTYTPDEQQRIQELLNSKLGREHLATRQGPGGSKLTYVEGNVALELANEVFGFNGWSRSILKTVKCTMAKRRVGEYYSNYGEYRESSIWP